MNSIPAPLPELDLSSLATCVEHFNPRHDAVDHWDLDAPYQRPSVWTVEQRRALIRSFMMGVPVGAVVYAALGYHDTHTTTPGGYYRVVDGQQRIRAVRAWFSGELDVPGHWFTTADLNDPEARGRMVTIADLSTRGSRGAWRWSLPSLVLDSVNETRRDASGEWEREPEAVVNGRRTGGGVRRYGRTKAEAVAFEAEVFLLLNGGGTNQTDDHMARVTEIASGC